MIDLPEVWEPTPRKFKTPMEYVVGVMRAVDIEPDYEELLAVLRSFGHLPFMAPSPAGWPDVARPWLNSDSALRRARFSASVAARRKLHGQNLDRTSEDTFEGLVPPETLQMIATAADATESLALLLASPAMQRR